MENDKQFDEILAKIGSLPQKPGVYQFKNKAGKVIYVGKAIKLRNRVKSYFRQGKKADAKTTALVRKITDVETIVTDSEAEALILEDTLIKKLKPRYNVLLRDDKTYPFVRVTNEDYPRLFPTRTLVRDGSKYYGPFTEVGPIKMVMKILRTLFYIRSCDYNLTDKTVENKKYKLCLDYHIKKCEGPCEGYVTKEHYRNNINMAIQILNGKTRNLERKFEDEMKAMSEEMKFEEAADARNKLKLLREYTSRQKIVSTELLDRDIFGMARVENLACTLVFKVRDGKLLGKRHYIINNADDQPDEEIIRRTMERWYIESEFIPKEIFLPAEPADFEYILDWLQQKSNKSVRISIPKIGEKKKIVQMAATNAEYILKDYLLAIERREQTVTKAVLSLQRDLHLKKPPKVIECFDNSHIQGSELVSSVVVFTGGRPNKSEYRKFKIKTVDKSDDFAAMREVVGRRYRRLIDEKRALPDLIIIDGGKGQLSSAYKVLSDLGIQDKVTVIGLAKRLEEVFFPNSSEAVMLPKTSGSLRLIQQLRDEAHRFAITFHRQQRSKRTLKTELTEIAGVGDISAKKLLIEFGSVEEIRKLPIDKLAEVVNKNAAKAIVEYFEKGK